jgi:hypothetical protein
MRLNTGRCNPPVEAFGKYWDIDPDRGLAIQAMTILSFKKGSGWSSALVGYRLLRYGSELVRLDVSDFPNSSCCLNSVVDAARRVV